MRFFVSPNVKHCFWFRISETCGMRHICISKICIQCSLSGSFLFAASSVRPQTSDYIRIGNQLRARNGMNEINNSFSSSHSRNDFSLDVIADADTCRINNRARINNEQCFFAIRIFACLTLVWAKKISNRRFIGIFKRYAFISNKDLNIVSNSLVWGFWKMTQVKSADDNLK